MSEQSELANKVARELGGGRVDVMSVGAAAPAVPEVPKVGPFVRLPAENYLMSRTAKEMGAILRTNGIYRRDEKVVTIDARKAGWRLMEPRRFQTYVENYMVPAKFKMVEGEPQWRPNTMSADTAAGILQSPAFLEQQRELVRVNTVPLPVMREDGRIDLLAEGYDAAARIFTLPSGIKVRDDLPLEEAVALIKSLYAEFPFNDAKEDGTSRNLAVCVAAMLSMFGVGLLGPLTSRMHFVYGANAVGSGKSLLAKLAIVPVAGAARVRVKGENSEELRKELSSAALDGDAYFFLDDLDGMLKSQELNAFMTSATMSGRMLGGLSGFTAEKQCVVFITGNNLKLSQDIARRVLRVSLYSEAFDVQERAVKRPIDEEWLCRPEVRGDVLGALWALIREWDKAGRPKGGRALRGFEKWCEVFGGIVAHAGFGDPCEAPPVDDNSGSNEISDMLALVELLHGKMQEKIDERGEPAPERRKEFTFQELVDACQENDCFSWAMEGTWKRDKDSSEEWLELNQKSKSALGRMFSEKFGGQIMRLRSGVRVRFGQRGRNRHRKYIVEQIEAENVKK